MPALFTKIDGASNVAFVADHAARIDLVSVTSTAKACVPSPISSAARCTPARSTSHSATLMPSLAKRCAMARPRPLAAPVTTAARVTGLTA
jgi:hypothetical protein